jgi:hypothetical protein
MRECHFSVRTDIFNDMLDKIYKGYYPLRFAEEAFLNYFGASAVRLPYVYNANLAIKMRRPQLWEAIVNNIRIVHYTNKKPFSAISITPQEELEHLESTRHLQGGLWEDAMGWWVDTWTGISAQFREIEEKCS